jgi:hypothetical protein
LSRWTIRFHPPPPTLLAEFCYRAGGDAFSCALLSAKSKRCPVTEHRA